MKCLIFLIKWFLICDTMLYSNKSPKGTNICAMVGVKWYGGCLEVCQRPSNEEKLGVFLETIGESQSKCESQTKSKFID